MKETDLRIIIASIVSFLLFFSPKGFSQDEGGDYLGIYAIGGLEGPILNIQAFLTALIGYQWNDFIDIGLSASFGGQRFDTPGHAAYEQSGYSLSAPVSIFPAYGFGYHLDGILFRFAPALQKIKTEECIANCDKGKSQDHQEWLNSVEQMSWRTEAYGIEWGMGYQWLNEQYVVEFIPFTLFHAYNEKIQGTSADSNHNVVQLRFITWRAGFRF